MEVATGKIRAISNLTRSEEGELCRSTQLCRQRKVEPGSTFSFSPDGLIWKMVHVTIQDSVDLNLGTYQYGDRVMKDSEGKHEYRNVTVEKPCHIPPMWASADWSPNTTAPIRRSMLSTYHRYRAG